MCVNVRQLIMVSAYDTFEDEACTVREHYSCYAATYWLQHDGQAQVPRACGDTLPAHLYRSFELASCNLIGNLIGTLAV